MTSPLEPTNIEIAFSYRTGDREKLIPIVDALKQQLGETTIFIDYLYEAWINGADSIQQVEAIYEKEAALVVRCWTPGYGESQWTSHEYATIQNRIMLFQRQKGSRCHEVLECWLGAADVADYRPAVIHLVVPGRQLSDITNIILDKLKLAKKYRNSNTVTSVTSEAAPIPQGGSPIDRDSVVDAIEKAVTAPNTRLVAIHGSEGTGKSTALDQWLRKRASSESTLRVRTTAVETIEHAGDLESLIHHAVATTFAVTPEEAKELVRKEKQSASICLVIDGINERGEAATWADLLRQAFHSERENLCLVVVTRTEHWQRVYDHLRTLEPVTADARGLRGDEPALRLLIPVQVPRFTLEEVRRYLTGFGVGLLQLADELLELLRVPRLLAIAVRHVDRLTSSPPPTYAMLQLLDFEHRHGKQFLSDVEQRVRDELSSTSSADVLRDDYINRLRAIVSNLANLAEDNALVWVALGVWLRRSLMPHAGEDHETLIERIEQVLGANEHDARATILEYATTSALLDAASPPSIRIALIDRWLVCRNRLDSPTERLGKLFAIAPLDILDAIEGAIASTGYRYLANEFIDILINTMQGSPRDLLRNRFRIWLGYYSDQHPMRDGEMAAKFRKEIVRRNRDTKAADFPVRKVEDRRCDLRSLALKVLLAAPDAVDADMIRAAVISVAINGRLGDAELLSWLLRRSPLDRASLYTRLQNDCAPFASLRSRVTFIVWQAIPANAERRWLKLRTLKGWKIWYLELADRMVDPGWRYSRNDKSMAYFAKVAARQPDTTSGIEAHELEACAGGLAIHRPKVMCTILTSICRHRPAPQRSGNTQLAIARSFAEALPTDAVAALAADDREAPASFGDDGTFAWMLCWSIRQQRARSCRRVGQVARLVRTRLVWDEFIDNAELDADAAHAFANRCIQATQAQDTDSRDAYAFVLSRCTTFRRATRDLLSGWLDKLDWPSMTGLQRERAEIIAWRIGAESIVARTSANGTEKSEISSMAVAQSAVTTMDEAFQQCLPSHWALWCESRGATSTQCAVFADALLAIHAKASLDMTALPPSAREAVAKWRRHGHLMSRFTESALRYWLVAMPGYLDRWLPTGIASIPLADLAEAAVDRMDHNALPFVRKLWDAELNSGSYTLQGLLRRSVTLAFRIAHAPEAHALWHEMLDEVRDDDELIRIVVCALAGNGHRWLRELVGTELHSAILFKKVRATAIAGIAGFDDIMRNIVAEPKKSKSTRDGWVEYGRQFAIEQYRRGRAAATWYARFRRTTDPMIRAGAWLQLVRIADSRFLEFEYSIKLDLTSAAAYHAKIHDDTLRKAAANHHDKLRKTLFGVSLPASSDGWFARTRRRL